MHEALAAQKPKNNSSLEKGSQDFIKKLFQDNEANDEKNERPLIQKVQLDLGFARVGSMMMLLKMLLSGFISDEVASDPSKVPFLKFLDDFFKKIRQVCQYSIHAQPGMPNRGPDDINSDLVHNLEAATLGKSVYNLNAFFAPWLSILRVIFPYSKNLGFGLLSRMIDFSDNAIGKMTNMFWNLRRISKGLIPYDGGALTTERFLDKQSEVRELISYCWNKYLAGSFAALKQIFVKDPGFVFEENARRAFVRQMEDNNKNLFIRSMKNYINNIKAIFTGKYLCPHEDEVIKKKIGQEEPENTKWYVRSKILSQVLSLPAGFFGTILNGSGITLNFLGNLIANQNICKLSDKLSDYANGLMSLVYMTGEVPANINECFKKMKRGVPFGGESGAYKNLLVATTGFIGMLNRMKVLPVISNILSSLGIKKVLDNYHRLFENFFLLFFSYNRLVLHWDERTEARNKSSARDVMKTQKHETFWKHFTLPFRVIFKDEDVTYDDEDFKDATLESLAPKVENEFAIAAVA